MSVPIVMDGFKFRPAWWLGKLRPWGQKDQAYKCPALLVVHCGSVGDDLAGYLANPTAKPREPGAVLCRDGLWRRQVATHGAWDPESQSLVQMVGLELEAWGTGSSRWHGVVAQRIAYHVELPGPPSQNRDGRQTGELIRFATALVTAVPTVTHWIRHSDIDNRKRDPGPGLDDRWARGILQRG